MTKIEGCNSQGVINPKTTTEILQDLENANGYVQKIYPLGRKGRALYTCVYNKQTPISIFKAAIEGRTRDI